MELDEFISKTVNNVTKLIQKEQEMRIIDVIFDISKGKYNCYNDYREQYLKEVDEYERLKEENMVFSKENNKLFTMIPITPPQLLSEDIYNYITRYKGE